MVHNEATTGLQSFRLEGPYWGTIGSTLGMANTLHLVKRETHSAASGASWCHTTLLLVKLSRLEDNALTDSDERSRIESIFGTAGLGQDVHGALYNYGYIWPLLKSLH